MTGNPIPRLLLTSKSDSPSALLLSLFLSHSQSLSRLLTHSLFLPLLLRTHTHEGEAGRLSTDFRSSVPRHASSRASAAASSSSLARVPLSPSPHVLAHPQTEKAREREARGHSFIDAEPLVQACLPHCLERQFAAHVRERIESERVKGGARSPSPFSALLALFFLPFLRRRNSRRRALASVLLQRMNSCVDANELCEREKGRRDAVSSRSLVSLTHILQTHLSTRLVRLSSTCHPCLPSSPAADVSRAFTLATETLVRSDDLTRASKCICTRQPASEGG